MDLDGFKDSNDVYGHAAGDLLLKEAAARIRATAPGVLVARAGGDEFAVLFADPAEGAVSRTADAILEAFRKPFAIGAYRVTIGISLGCAGAEAGTSEDHDELMRRADVAMYAAKAEGKHCVRIYSPVLDDGHLMRMRLEKDLAASVAAGEIFVLYQPIVHSVSKDIVAVEALARWRHPEHGDVPPDVFIPIAEMSGLISELGRQVLLQACRAMRHVDVELAVNLSPAQFWDGALLRDVDRVLKETGFPPERLELEITESLLLSRPDKAAKVIDGLRARGIRIALDDFGTGFASIGYLQRLTLDRIKIDKTFIGPLGHDPKSRDMLVSIIGIAKALDLMVCAEGVETIVQSEMARLSGCTRLQGWLFGKAVPIGEIRYLIDEMRAARRKSA
jgi:diguanylate cyclase (GGDEF)-like protein